MAEITGTAYSGSTFTIRELTGDQRTVVLQGRGMPYRPFSLKGNQNKQFTWLPGNPIATATVLGPQEEPTDLKGFWKDKYIGDPASTAGIGAPIVLNGSPVTTVRDAAKLLDDIRRKGQLVEVTWDIQVRVGLLDEFEQLWHNVHDLEWNMKFSWISQGEPAAAAQVATDTTTSDLQLKLLAAMRTATSATFPPTFPASLSLLNALQSAFQKLNSYVANIAGSVTNLATLAMTPFQINQQCISTCANIIGTISDTVNTIDDEATIGYNMAVGRQGTSALFNQSGSASNGLGAQIGLDGVGTLALNKSGVLVSADSQGQILESGRNLNLERLSMIDRITAYTYIRGVRQALYAVRSIAIIGQQTLAKQISSTLLGIYTVKEHDDLRTVSSLYYNTPYQWQLIAEFNQLDTFELTVGQVLLIPQANTGEV